MRNGVIRPLFRGALLGLIGLWLQAQWVAHRGYPAFPDLDPSGVFGDPTKPRLRIAALGDSTITGIGLESADEIWIRQVIAGMSDDYSITLDSYAVGGARICDVLEQQVPRMPDRRYDIIVLSVAANDAIHGSSRWQIERHLAVLVDQLLESCQVLILAGVGDVGTAPRLPPPLSQVATLRSRSTDHAHASIAATRPQVRKVPMWEETTPVFRSGADLFSPDRFHPNVRGHAVWASAIRPVLRDAAAEIVNTRMAHP